MSGVHSNRHFINKDFSDAVAANDESMAENLNCKECK
jgi:hypothetical protein